MRQLKNKNFRISLLAAAVTTALVGCGGGSSGGGTASPTSTTFSVSVDAPQTLLDQAGSAGVAGFSLFQNAYAATAADLGAENFKIVIVDSNGVITEEIPADQIEVEVLGNGEYEVSVPGNPQLNCLILVDLSGSLEITAETTTLQDTNALFAPTTSTEGLDIDLESSVAYQQFLDSVDTFDNYDVDDPAQVAAVEQLINNVETQLENLNLEEYLNVDGTDLEDLLAGNEVTDSEGNSVTLDTLIDNVVDAVIEQQIADIDNATEATLASIVSNGGIFWFDEDEYGAFPSSGVETIYNFDFEGGEWVAETFDPATDTANDDYLLTATGWVHQADFAEVASINSTEGSVIIQDAAVSVQQVELSTLQAIDLSPTNGEGRGIQTFLEQYHDSDELPDLVSESATFSRGAIAINTGIAAVNAHYVLWYDEGEEDGTCWGNEFESPSDYNGNCETVYVYGSSGFATSLNDLVTSTESSPNNSDFNGFTIWGDDDESIRVQLLEVDDGSSTEEIATGEDATAVTAAIVRTARFFTLEENDLGEEEWVLYTAEDDSTPTWSYETPAGLAEGESLISFTIPVALQGITEDSVMIYGVIDGYVRPGHQQVAGEVVDNSWVFNQTAANDILGAFLPASELYGLISGSTLSATGFDVDEITFGTEGRGSIKFTANEDNEFNENDVNPISDWTVDPSAQVITFTETTGDSTSTDYWNWTLTVTNIADGVLTVNITVEGQEDGSAVSGSGTGTLEVSSLAFTQDELVAGSPYYNAYYNDDPECSTGWVPETISFSADGNYSLTGCSENATTETGTYSVSGAGVLTLNFSDNESDYIKRMDLDTDLNADVVCWEGSLQDLDNCSSDSVGEYWFDNETSRDNFITSQNAASEEQVEGVVQEQEVILR